MGSILRLNERVALLSSLGILRGFIFNTLKSHLTL
jgi:hypothetical protein